MAETRADDYLVFLFSSNIRPLYEQDILDVLAAPEGVRYRFRYEDRYVGKTLKEQWGERLRGVKVVVLFSLQQEAKYHDPAFFPVRLGTVRRAWREAKYLFVEFIVGDYVALEEPPADEKRSDQRPNVALDEPPPDEKRSDQRPKWDHWVKEFSKRLGAHVETPYDCSASIGKDVLRGADLPVDIRSEPTVLFERSTRYLARTDSFRAARFIRFLRLVPEGASDEKPLEIDAASNVFTLTAGVTYRLHVLQTQPRDVSAREPFVVKGDGELISVIGREGFDIASRYDVIEIPIHARYHSSIEIRDTVLVVEPGQGIKGPAIRLPLRVLPPEDSAQ